MELNVSYIKIWIYEILKSKSEITNLSKNENSIQENSAWYCYFSVAAAYTLIEFLVEDVVQTTINDFYYKTLIDKGLCVLLSQPYLRLLYQW